MQALLSDKLKEKGYTTVWILANPLTEEGQDLVVRINDYIMKVHQLKDIYFVSNR